MEMAPDLAEHSAIRPRLAPSAKLACIALLYAAVAACLFPRSYLSAFGDTRLVLYYLLLPPMMLVGLAVAGMINRPKSPLSFVREKLVSRGIGAISTIAIFMVCVAAFTAYKHDLSGMVTFFADPWLAGVDAAIHFGDSWRWTRSVPVPAPIDRVLYILYSQFWIIQVAMVVLLAAWLERPDARQRYFVALMTMAIVLGLCLRVLGSSAGPIFYDRIFAGSRFVDLMSALKDSNAGPDTQKISDYLYASYTTNRAVVGSGISAMPSFHVAIVTLNALFLWSLNRWVGAAAWAYAAVIMFGSVYFGWHYAVDGYVSILATLLIWRLAGHVRSADPDARRLKAEPASPYR